MIQKIEYRNRESFNAICLKIDEIIAHLNTEQGEEKSDVDDWKDINAQPTESKEIGPQSIETYWEHEFDRKFLHRNLPGITAENILTREGAKDIKNFIENVLWDRCKVEFKRGWDEGRANLRKAMCSESTAVFLDEKEG